ncbi:MAG TPA: DUF3800 domain-containing protein [Rhizobium sp.]|nr:DUF3800 domain-containing protein [Rhizobium sp.]
MYLMYVDESGDPGMGNSPTNYFALSGLVVHESRWRDLLNILVTFKKTMRAVHGLRVRQEIHASEFINSRAFDAPRHVRLAILRNTIDEIAKIDFVSITNVVVSKVGKPATYDVFQQAWLTLFQRFENTLKYGNFPGGHTSDCGIVITDATNGTALLRLVRKMAVINYIPNQTQFGNGTRNMPLIRVIEDPHGKDSKETLALQAVDVVAYFLAQRFRPNNYIRKSGATFYFDRLSPVLNLKARTGGTLGIVTL